MTDYDDLPFKVERWSLLGLPAFSASGLPVNPAAPPHLPEVFGHLARGFLTFEVTGEKLNVPTLHGFVEHHVDHDWMVGRTPTADYDRDFLAHG